MTASNTTETKASKKQRRDLSDLYAIATDPGSSQKQLREVWSETKSVKIRKAVASNLNCDTNTMRIAARLYLKEVINNPSFKLMKMFGEEDKFINALFEAFETPDKYANSSKWATRINNADQQILARTVLLSPNIGSYKTLDRVFASLGTTDIKREMRDEQVRNRIRSVSIKNLNKLGPSTIVDLFNVGVVDIEEFDAYLDTCKPGSIYTNSGNCVKRLLESQLESGGNIDYELVFKLMVSCSPATIRAVMKSLMTRSSGDKFLPILSDIYKDMLYFDVARVRKENSKPRSSAHYGYYYNSGLGTSYSSYHISSCVWKFIDEKYTPKVRNKEEAKGWYDIDLNQLMADVGMAGFAQEYVQYTPKVKLHTSLNGKGYEYRLKLLERLMEIRLDSDFLYAVTVLVKGGFDFFAKAAPGTVDYKFAERIWAINNLRFAQGQEPVVKYCNLSGSSPTFNVLNGVAYGKSYQVSGKGPALAVLPPLSGRVSSGLIDSYVKRA